MHTHYKGTGKVHSFRGQLEDGEQKTIDIQGSVGAIAWRITKFQLFPSEPGVTKGEQLVKIYLDTQTAVTGAANFKDNSLLAAAYMGMNDAAYYGNDYFVIFDNMIFNMDLHITHKDNATGVAVNYYIELEEVKISAAGMAQLAVAAARRT